VKEPRSQKSRHVALQHGCSMSHRPSTRFTLHVRNLMAVTNGAKLAIAATYTTSAHVADGTPTTTSGRSKAV
jgi:hypothetical protein